MGFLISSIMLVMQVHAEGFTITDWTSFGSGDGMTDCLEVG